MFNSTVTFVRSLAGTWVGSLFYRSWMPVALLLVFLAPMLQSCQSSVPRDASVAALAPLEIAPTARRFRLRSDQSRLLVLVYRDGRLANLGHNHVISSDDLEGEIYFTDDLSNSAFEVRLPVTTMEVDLPQNRAEAGDDFPGELAPDAVSGTRANMLGDQQLDAEAWPEIILRSRRIRGASPDIVVQVEIAVRSHVHAVDIPMRVAVSGEQITVTGRFQLNQTDLGMEPFSVMMGALKVRDQLDIQFSLVAEAG